MAYSIVELQTDVDGNTAAPPVVTEADKDEAKSKFHNVCVYSSVSKVYYHVVLLLDEQGNQIMKDVSIHAPPPPPPPEPEPEPDEGQPETDGNGDAESEG